MQSASSMETGPSPFACKLNDPENFNALASAAASASAWPINARTGGAWSCRVSSVCAKGPSRISRPRTGRSGR